MQKRFDNRVRVLMKEISSEQVEKIEAKYGGWFYLVKVIIQPHVESEEVIEWWQVFRSNGPFEDRFVTHAPTKKLAIQAIAILNNSQHGSCPTMRWDLSAEDKVKCKEMETALKEIKCLNDLAKAKQKAEEVIEKKKRAEARQKRKKQKEHIELLEKVGETERFTGIEI